ncbi:DUF2798 domain-containing protein [Vibrio sp. 10N.286.49.B1]|uniref:DUF2798 domain-containing protein n=1 Tax=unclassified Vibrio TaxID=2614977 RepID=UPI000C850E03|nr:MULTISPECIES: DUF2798 domain-containing protein [unclassified Vibrio]
MNTNTVDHSDISMLSPAKTPLGYKVVVVIGMMMLMGGSLTGVMTYVNVGYSDAFVSDWLRSFLTVAVTVMPAGMFLMGVMTKLFEHLMPDSNEKKRNLAIGMSMAVVMESLMAFTTALNNIGFSDPSAFLSAWFNGLVAALPVALVLMTVISITVKPKLERFLKS